MTTYLLDVASYQGDLSPADVKRAGFSAVNLKISHGLTQKAVHPRLAWWIDQAGALGLGISTFHYFTADAPGEGQAQYAYHQLLALGLTDGTAHQMDVESNPVPALGEIRTYLTSMQEMLGRPVSLYTGDWWWTARPLWHVNDLTPYLWSAPNAGYLASYPGDTSSHWNAGYGGWPNLSIMQYAVAPLSFPDGSRGTINVSKSAIRDPAVWRALTQGRPGVSYAPDTLLAARTFYMSTLATAGYKINPLAVGIVGDDSHANAGTSYHLGEDALSSGAYSVVESSRDKNGLTNAAAALDLGWFSISVKGKVHNLRTFSIWLVAQCKANTPDTQDIREVIYSTDGLTVKRWDRLGKRTTGDSSHLSHTHESWFRDSEKRDKTAHLRRYFTEIGVLEDDVALTEDDKQWFRDNFRTFPLAATGGATFGGSVGAMVSSLDKTSPANIPALADKLGTMAASVNALVVASGADPVDEDAIVRGVLEGLGGGSMSDAEIAELLAAALGDRAAAVGTLLSAPTPPAGS